MGVDVLTFDASNLLTGSFNDSSRILIIESHNRCAQLWFLSSFESFAFVQELVLVEASYLSSCRP